MIDLLLIAALLALGFYWSNAMKAREIAYAAVVVHCQKMEVQLLDDYVALTGFWLKRDDYGKLVGWRSYQFEFTSTGEERYQGKVVLVGKKVTNIQLDVYRI
jgi:hypothetical protein